MGGLQAALLSAGLFIASNRFMQDPFSQVVDDSAVGNDDDDALMTRATDRPMSAPSSASKNKGARPVAPGKNSREPLAPSEFANAARAKRVCPFCGSINERHAGEHDDGPPCPKCAMQDTATTRQATKARIGPWFVRQTRNPSAPGMRFETLLMLVKRGQVSPGSVVRGPTTHQLWKFAAQVKGLSREFGLCHSCGGAIEHASTMCPACSRMQEPPVNPDVLLEAPAQAPVSPATAPAPAQPKPAPAPQRAPVPIPQPPSPVPLSKKPAAPELPGGRPRNGALRRGEEILTARELAAAFQLDFAPANERSKGGEWQPRKLGRKVALVAVLLLIAGVVGAFVKRPDWRDNASAWASDTYASVKDVVASASTNSKSTTAPTKPAPQPEVGEDPLDRASVSSGSLRVTDQTEPEPETTTTSITRPRPRATPPSPVEDIPVTLPPSSTQSPRPTDPVATVPTEETATTPNVSASMSSADQLDQARTLYRQAIDAERKRPAEYAEAVRLYEKVKKLPREVWPGDLEIRLERARRAMK